MRGWRSQLTAAAIVAAIALPGAGYGSNGLINVGYGPKARGMAGAGIAYSQESLAAAINPAGLVHVGCRADIAAYWKKQHATADFTPQVFYTEDCIHLRSNEDLWWPELGFLWMPCCNQAVTLAFYSYGQSQVHYDEVFGFDDGRSFVPSDPGRVDFSHYFLTPAWAWQCGECNSFGISANLSFSSLQVKGMQFLRDFSIDPERVTNQGDDWEVGIGARVGWTHQLYDVLRLGITYQTKQWIGQYHKYRGLLPTRGEADLPAQLGLGIAYFPRCNVVFALDIVKVFWRDGKWFENVGPSPSLYLGDSRALGANEGRGLGWNEQMIYRVGLSWDVWECLTVRGGFNYGNSVVPAGNVWDFLMPLTITQHVTLGASYRWCDYEFSLAYINGRSHDVSGATLSREAKMTLSSWERSLGLSISRCF
jgi:long-chain fatty acid transport protein